MTFSSEMPTTISTEVTALLLIPLAPLPYWALGLPWCLGADRRRIPLAPLVGCALAGLYAELALILGLSPRGAVAGVTVASAIFAVLRGRAAANELRAAVQTWLPLYLLAVLVTSLAPFPALGNWSGDWYLLFDMGVHVMGNDLPASMLARPPLFGAAAAPLWLVGQGLIPYQMMSAVASASTATAVLFFVDHFWPKAPRWLLLPMLLSPFFLHNTAAVWGKFLAAALILAAVVEARRGHVWVSSALFALSLANHESSVIWAPFVLAAHAATERKWKGALAALPAMAICTLAIAGPLLVWILVKYGLAAKINGNPALTEHSHQPFALKTALVVVTTFIGWEPLASAARWFRNPQRLSSAVIAKESFWLVTSWFTTMAGTMVGLLFPFVLGWRRLRDDPVLRRLVRPSILLSVAFALIANGVLCGYSSTEGSMQTSMIVLALGAYGLLAGAVASAGAASWPTFRKMSWLMGVVGTLPWVLANLVTAVGIWLSPAFRERMRTGSEGDYNTVVHAGLHPLGMAAFPEVPMLAGLLLVTLLWYTHRRSPPSLARHSP